MGTNVLSEEKMREMRKEIRVLREYYEWTFADHPSPTKPQDPFNGQVFAHWLEMALNELDNRDPRAVALNFSWLRQGLVAGCREPRTDEELEWLAARVQALVRLAEEDDTSLGGSEVERHGIRDCHEPVRDLMAPTQGQLDRVVRFIIDAVRKNELVAVSSGVGYGSTGTVLACYLVAEGLEPQAAVEKLIASHPGSEESLRAPGQMDAVIEFGRRTASRAAH